jgi:hypothetical protein
MQPTQLQSYCRSPALRGGVSTESVPAVLWLPLLVTKHDSNVVLLRYCLVMSAALRCAHSLAANIAFQKSSGGCTYACRKGSSRNTTPTAQPNCGLQRARISAVLGAAAAPAACCGAAAHSRLFAGICESTGNQGIRQQSMECKIT